jgi:hypothetical protein
MLDRGLAKRCAAVSLPVQPRAYSADDGTYSYTRASLASVFLYFAIK